MIDFYNSIYTAAAVPLRAHFPGIYVTGEVSDQIARFPCVQIEESRNIPSRQDNADRSSYARLQYRVRIYTNKENSRVSEARAILAYLDSIYEPMNLRRKTYVAQNGMYNNSTYRIEATYEVEVDANGVLYRV